jgi:hypothetical protein
LLNNDAKVNVTVMAFLAKSLFVVAKIGETFLGIYPLSIFTFFNAKMLHNQFDNQAFVRFRGPLSILPQLDDCLN